MERLELRPAVAAFAQLMEAQLRANDHKPEWQDDDPFDLLRRLQEETSELYQVLLWRRSGMDSTGRPVMAEQVGREAADVSNFALFIADVVGALEPAQPAQQAGRRGEP